MAGCNGISLKRTRVSHGRYSKAAVRRKTHEIRVLAD